MSSLNSSLRILQFVPQFLNPKLHERLLELQATLPSEIGKHIPKRAKKAVVDLKEKARKDLLLQPQFAAREISKLYSVMWKKLPPVCKAVGECEVFRIATYQPDKEQNGHFAVHRDTDSPLTKDRLFGFVCALNSPMDYHGGELFFPELGIECRLPKNTAVFFDANLLHGVRAVTHGQRIVLLSFLSL